MEETNDGFIIADEDLKLRGPGEFFGIKQSGFFQFKIANMISDGSIIWAARQAAFEMIKNHPDLQESEHRLLGEIFFQEYADHLEMIALS